LPADTGTAAALACLPPSLLWLDLSFTEGLALPPGCFLHCPQLTRLTLDGCQVLVRTLPPPAR